MPSIHPETDSISECRQTVGGESIVDFTMIRRVSSCRVKIWQPCYISCIDSILSRACRTSKYIRRHTNEANGISCLYIAINPCPKTHALLALGANHSRTVRQSAAREDEEKELPLPLFFTSCCLLVYKIASLVWIETWLIPANILFSHHCQSTQF